MIFRYKIKPLYLAYLAFITKPRDKIIQIPDGEYSFLDFLVALLSRSNLAYIWFRNRF